MEKYKLKTLKDIIQIDHAEDGLIVYRRLKIEGLKLLKHMKERYNGSCDGAYFLIYIRDFFNLTEEDLKDE